MRLRDIRVPEVQKEQCAHTQFFPCNRLFYSVQRADECVHALTQIETTQLHFSFSSVWTRSIQPAAVS